MRLVVKWYKETPTMKQGFVMYYLINDKGQITKSGIANAYDTQYLVKKLEDWSIRYRVVLKISIADPSIESYRQAKNKFLAWQERRKV